MADGWVNRVLQDKSHAASAANAPQNILKALVFGMYSISDRPLNPSNHLARLVLPTPHEGHVFAAEESPPDHNPVF